jgi:transmembrane sensor
LPPLVRAAWVAAAACAAVALVLVGRASQHHAQQGRVYATTAGQRETVTLADGTRFSLGPESRLRVPVDFGVRTRAVDLEGEGYFRVVHDTRHPFAVRAANAVVTDVGTAFDVRAYADDGAVRIAVAEGEVGVVADRAAGMPPVRMPPVRMPPVRMPPVRMPPVPTSLGAGDVAVVGNTTIAVTHGVDVAALTAWTDGTLVFRETPLRVVVRDLARSYGADVTLGDPSLADVPFTATLPEEALSKTVEIVASAVGARVEHAGTQYRLVMPGGTFRVPK